MHGSAKKCGNTKISCFVVRAWIAHPSNPRSRPTRHCLVAPSVDHCVVWCALLKRVWCRIVFLFFFLTFSDSGFCTFGNLFLHFRVFKDLKGCGRPTGLQCQSDDAGNSEEVRPELSGRTRAGICWRCPLERAQCGRGTTGNTRRRMFSEDSRSASSTSLRN